MITVNAPGYYSVMTESYNCCVQYDTVEVILFDFRLPNAFTPNNDGLNDKFRALGPNNGIRNFNLSVYDRLGTLVFESNNVDKGWDGTYKNQPSPAGVYTWTMTFNVAGSVEGVNKVTKRGCVTLLR
jgi:gliding motility-associated-like protein